MGEDDREEKIYKVKELEIQNHFTLQADWLLPLLFEGGKIPEKRIYLQNQCDLESFLSSLDIPMEAQTFLNDILDKCH